MRMLILTTAAMSTLALAACNQHTETTAPAAEDNAVDAVAIDTNEAPPGPVIQAPRAPRTATPAIEVEDEVVAIEPSTGGMMDGPSPEVRDAAKEKAESTNLHPAG